MLVEDLHMIVPVALVTMTVAPFGTVVVVAFFVAMIALIVAVFIVASISFFFLVDRHRYQVDVVLVRCNRRCMAVAAMVLGRLVGIARHCA